MMDAPNDVFKHLYLELIEISPKRCDKSQLLNILLKLNQLNYKEKLPFITTWTCTDMLLHLIGLLKEFSQDELYLNQLCQLIVNIAAKQRIVICSMSVSVILHGLRDIWLRILADQNSKSSEMCLHALGAISAVTYGNGAYIIPELLEWLVGKDGRGGSIGALLQSPISLDLRKMCLQCLSGLCMTSDSREKLNEDYMHHCLQLFIKALQIIPDVKDSAHYRVVFAAHKGLQYILDGSSGIHIHEIGPLLAILKKHLVFGLATDSGDFPCVLQPIPVPPTLHPSSAKSAPQPSAPSQSAKKKKKRRSKKLNTSTHTKRSDVANLQGIPNLNVQSATAELHVLNLHDPDRVETSSAIPAGSTSEGTLSSSEFSKIVVTSSESDFSDTEGGQLAALTSFALKIRQMAIGSLYVIVRKTNKMVMLGYWNSFLPGSSSSYDVSLLSCIVNDPGTKARVTALMVLCAMLEGSRSFLSLATQETASTSFVSYSANLASSIHGIHDVLLKALVKENSSFVQVHILKAMSFLAANTPYTKLNAGLVASIITEVRKIVALNRDIDCRIGGINVLVSFLSSDPALLEVACCVTDTELPSFTTQHHGTKHLSQPLANKEVNSRSWLVEDCINICIPTSETSSTPLPFRVAALQLITTACKLYFIIIRPYLHKLTDVIHHCMLADDTTVQLHSFKLLEEIGKSLLRNLQKDEDCVVKSHAFWNRLLSDPIQVVAQKDIHFVNRSHICDFLSAIGPTIFDKLSRKLQLFCQTLLLGLTCDENYLVRSAAIRSLATYIMYPALRRDVCFVEDVAGCIIRLMQDSIKSVQSNAAWSFGNFTDAIIINIEADVDSFSLEQIRKSLLKELIEIAIQAFAGKDKVRFNMMRVLGNMLRFFNKFHAENELFREKMLQAKTLIINAMLKDPLMKVRWNACLACGNMLQNDTLPIGKPEWTDDVFTALCTAVALSKNYKVRIKAAIALGCPQTREAFGTQFSSVYVCILNTLTSSDDETIDFGEYKFKDQLQEQLTYTLLQLTELIDVQDMSMIVTCMSNKSKYQFIRMQLNKWHSAIANSNECLIQETECYAALGQFTATRKLNMFKNANLQWQQAVKSFFASKSFKEIELNIESASHFNEFFTVQSLD